VHAESGAAEPSRVGAALAALLGRGRTKPPAAPPAASARADDAAGVSETDGSTDTTRGLLAAKRRARDRM
jgi:hypothetical protein